MSLCSIVFGLTLNIFFLIQGVGGKSDNAEWEEKEVINTISCPTFCPKDLTNVIKACQKYKLVQDHINKSCGE